MFCHGHCTMRRFIALLAGLLLSLTALAAGPRYALEVKGLACPFCAYGIEKRLYKVEGVEDVSVDLASGRVVVTVKEGVTFTREKAGKAVDEAGFSLDSFERIEPPEEGNGDAG